MARSEGADVTPLRRGRMHEVEVASFDLMGAQIDQWPRTNLRGDVFESL